MDYISEADALSDWFDGVDDDRYSAYDEYEYIRRSIERKKNKRIKSSSKHIKKTLKDDTTPKITQHGYCIIQDSRIEDDTFLYLVDRKKTHAFWWTKNPSLAIHFQKESAAKLQLEKLKHNNARIIKL